MFMFRCLPAMLFLFCLLSPGLSLADHHWAESYYGVYETKGKIADSPGVGLKGPVREEWQAPAKARRPYRIGILFPHLKDSYFLAVNYGLLDEARKLGVRFELQEAGSYLSLGNQIEQYNNFVRQKVDGIILAAISYRKMDPLIAEALARGVPTVEVINDIRAPAIQAKALVSFFEMGYKAGTFCLRAAQGKDARVAFLPGPDGSGWAADTYDGFCQAIKENPEGVKKGKITIYDPLYGDTGKEAQEVLLGRSFSWYKDINFLVGNAVMAEVAPAWLAKNHKDPASVTIVSTYLTPPVYQHILSGKVAAAPSDLTVMQGRMAMDMMVRILNGEKPGKDFPFRAGPMIPLISKENIATYPYEMLFGPRDFKPVLSFTPPSLGKP